MKFRHRGRGRCACSLALACTPDRILVGADRRRREAFLDNVNETTLKLGIEQSQAGWVPADLHHRRHRSDRRARQPGGHRRGRAASPRRRRDSTRSSCRPTSARQLNLLKIVARDGDAVRSEGVRGADEDHGAARVDVRQRQVVPDPTKPDTCQNIDDVTHSHGRGRATRRRCARRGRAGTRSRRRCARTTRASSSCRTKARGSSGSPTPARCGGRNTTCRPTSSPRSSIGCGIRCGRST